VQEESGIPGDAHSFLLSILLVSGRLVAPGAEIVHASTAVGTRLMRRAPHGRNCAHLDVQRSWMPKSAEGWPSLSASELFNRGI
jgi:hypothetical protein